LPLGCHGGTMAGRAEHIMITDKFLRALRRRPPPARPKLIYDKALPQLILRRSNTGALTWGTKAKEPEGKSKVWRSLGNVYVGPREPRRSKPGVTKGALTIAEARQACRKRLEQRADGIDPKREARKAQAEAAQRWTFVKLREEYLKAFSTRRKHGEATRILHREFKAWEGSFANEIDAGDVEAAIQVMVDRKAKYQARNAFGYIRAMYKWATSKPSTRIKASPCEGLSIDIIIGEPKKSRDRWFRDAEVRQMWAAADQIGTAGAVIKLLFLTGKRENEIAYMRWAEIADDDAIYIPRHRDDVPGRPEGYSGMKSGREYLQPITPMMREILKTIDRGKAGDFVFSTTGGEKPMTIGSKVKAKLIKAGMPEEPAWVFHDIRRTARTNWAKLAIAEEIREAMLDHVKPGLKKVYNVHEYGDEKRDGFMLWETALQRILNPAPATVTDIRARRAS